MGHLFDDDAMMRCEVGRLAIVGFFFFVTSGVQHLDNLRIDRTWTETDGRIALRIPPAGRDHSARYRFFYRVAEARFSAECFGRRKSWSVRSVGRLVRLQSPAKSEFARRQGIIFA